MKEVVPPVEQEDENTDRYDDDPEVRATWAEIETNALFSLEHFRKVFAKVRKE